MVCGSTCHSPFAASYAHPTRAPLTPAVSSAAGVSLALSASDSCDPESEYERRHENSATGDLHAVPDFARTAPNRFRKARR